MIQIKFNIDEKQAVAYDIIKNAEKNNKNIIAECSYAKKVIENNK